MSHTSTAAPAPPAKYIAKLPSVPDVATLMGRVHKDLLAAYASCHALTPRIEPEAVLEVKVRARAGSGGLREGGHGTEGPGRGGMGSVGEGARTGGKCR